MTRAVRTRAAVALVAALLLLGGAALALRGAGGEAPPPARDPGQRPTLALLTSLPLLFAERFSIAGGGSATLDRLDQRYNVQPIGIADTASLAGKDLLLLAHPRAQPAEVLVELDQWVRQGGRLVLLADPKLDWHSDLPLGDRLRPPPYFADTGLLGHWGLRLDGPAVDGRQAIAIPGGEIVAVSAGRLRGRQNCRLLAAGFIARCALGRGSATVIADADFLDLAGAADGAAAANLDLLIGELARLEQRRD